jgi:hypothetical protein
MRRNKRPTGSRLSFIWIPIIARPFERWPIIGKSMTIPGVPRTIETVPKASAPRPLLQVEVRGKNRISVILSAAKNLFQRADRDSSLRSE